MSLHILIAQRAEQDLALQYRWYAEEAGMDVAEQYLVAVHDTIQVLAKHPDLGVRRRFQSPELVHIRSIPIAKPFHRHLLFYRHGDTLRIERVMHGARDLQRRLSQEPGTE
jgi:toxin ParE1/3/4